MLPLLWAVGLAPAVQGQGMTGEILLAGMPEPFELGWQGQKDNMDMSEYVPHGETVDDWTRMITVQVFHGTANAGAASIAAQVGDKWAAACPGGTAAESVAGDEGGYDFALWAYDCAENPQTAKPESMFLKVMVGVDALYMVQYAFRASADDAMITDAMTYLKDVGVCDTRLPEKACPEGI
jgi:hypothetical protein